MIDKRLMYAQGQRVAKTLNGSRPGYAGPNEPNDGQGVGAGAPGPGDTGGEGGTNPSDKSDTQKGPDPETNRESYRTDQYTTGPKTRTKTVTGTITKGPKAGETYSYKTKTPFSPKSKTGFGKKGKDTWHEAAVKNINKNIKDVDKTLNPSKFGLLDIVLTIGSLGLINPAVTEIARTISNVRTGLKVADLVSDPTKTKSVKDTVKDVLTKTAKNEISKKTGIDVKTIDTTIDTIQKALDTKIGKSVVDKFNSLNTTNKNTTKTTTFNGGDNNGADNAIVPVVPELITEEVIVKEPTSSLSDMATLDLLRNRQNRRRSFFNANSGGLAGLFKVKKQ